MADLHHTHCFSHFCVSLSIKMFTAVKRSKRSCAHNITEMAHSLSRTFQLPHCLEGVEERFATLALVRNVTKCAHLRNQASAGLVNAALLNPTLVSQSPVEKLRSYSPAAYAYAHFSRSIYTQLCSEFHVLTAVNKAVMRRADNQMKTKNIYSEIIYNLSPSTNVSCHES